MNQPRKLIVLDRDGVINEDSTDYIKSEDEWMAIPGSVEAIARLNGAGYDVVIATNQSGLARGLFDEIALARIHQRLIDTVESVGGHITGIFFCPHAPGGGCDCRKPGTGLLRAIEEELGASLAGAAFVGDSLKDLQAAQAWHMQPVLVRSGKGRQTESQLSDAGFGAVPVYDDLLAVVDRHLRV